MKRLENIATSAIEVTMREILVIPYDETNSWVVPGVVTTKIRPGLKGNEDTISFELMNAQKAFNKFGTTPPTYSNGSFVPAYAVHFNRRTIGVFTIEMFELLAGELVQTDQIEHLLTSLSRQLGETLAAFAIWNLFRGDLILDSDLVESCRVISNPAESYVQFRAVLEDMAKVLMTLAGKSMSQNARMIENGRGRSNYHPSLLIRDLRQMAGFGSKHFGVEVIWGAFLGDSPAKFSYRQQLPSFVDLYNPPEEYLPSKHQAEVIERILPHVEIVLGFVRPSELRDLGSKIATDSL